MTALALRSSPALTDGSRKAEPATLGRRLLIAAMLLALAVVLFVPLVSVFAQALAQGWRVALQAISEPEARAAIGLTLLVAAITVPLNLVFGVAAAWVITRFDFRGKKLLQTVIDLPLAVSPVIAGLAIMLVWGLQSPLGRWADERGIALLFALPGIVLATLFITLPYVTRQLVPLLQARGVAQEEAARTLGASGWQTFWRVTLPGMRWALLQGAILANARAMGEFGAVSVVSGHIRGQTNTMPLHIEILTNEYQVAAAFAMASLLALLALATLAMKSWLERREAR